MRKKSLVTFIAVMLTLFCAVGFVACTDDPDPIEGTYYLWCGGQLEEDYLITIKGGYIEATRTVDGETHIEFSGSYTVRHGLLIVEGEENGKPQYEMLEILEDGIIKDDSQTYYCKKGKLPPNYGEEFPGSEEFD